MEQVKAEKVQKTKPHKKIAETNAIFAQVHKSNKDADKNPKEIRISIDAKAKMNIGNFSRGGRNRVLTKAEDHDLGVKTKLTPFGFYLPQYDDIFLFFTKYPKILNKFSNINFLIASIRICVLVLIISFIEEFCDCVIGFIISIFV